MCQEDPENSWNPGVLGPRLGQTHEAGAAPTPAFPASEIPGIPGMATREASGDSGFDLFLLFAFFQERWGPEFLLLFGG